MYSSQAPAYSNSYSANNGLVDRGGFSTVGMVGRRPEDGLLGQLDSERNSMGRAETIVKSWHG